MSNTRKPAQREAFFRYGSPIRGVATRRPEVLEALLKRATRTKRDLGHVCSTILESWHELQEAMKPEVLEALEAEAKRCNMPLAKLGATLLQYWYEDTYLPAQAASK